MPDRFIQTHIRRLPLFEHVPEPQLELIAGAFQVLRFQPGETVFHQGQPAQGLYMFVSGRGILIQTGASGVDQPVGTVGANQYLNEAALFKPITDTASLRIMEPSILLMLSRQRLRQLVADHPEIKANLGLRAGDTITPRHEMAFAGQRDNENVLFSTRLHWWAFAGRAWLPIALAALLFALGLFIQTPPFTFLLIVASFIFPGALILYFYLEWRNDFLVITDLRILHFERTLLTFSERVSEIPLASVNEVNAEIPTTDPFARVFNYGTLQLKTAGTAGNIRLTFIPNPDGVQELIFANRSIQQEKMALQQRQSIRAEIDKVLGAAPGKSPAASADSSVPPRAPSTGRPSLVATKFTNAAGATVYRKHFTVWLRNVFLPAIILLVGAIVFGLCLVSPTFQSVGLLGYILSFFILLVGGIWFYWADWDWRNDIYIVDDETISLIHKRPLWLQNENDQILLSRVDNVVSDMRGLFQSLLNYGDVRISLLGGDKSSVKVFEKVANPRDVQEEISRRQARAKRRAQEAEDRRQREAIGEYLSVYHESLNSQAGFQANSAFSDAAQTPPDPGAPSSPPPPIPDRSRPPGIPRVRRDRS